MTYEVKVREPNPYGEELPTLETRGPGCEGFLVRLPKGADADDAYYLANRLRTLLDHAYHAGHEHALFGVRAALGCRP